MQTIGTITETQTASYRTIHDILRFTPRWPDPKSCCGVLFCVFDNKDKCWEAINRVRSTYNDSLRSAIDEILDDEEDRLGLNTRYRPFFCHSIYMVGRKQKRSNPVIFFCCEDASLRIKARDIVKASAIMRGHAAIRLGHASFPPEVNAPPRFAAEAQARMDLKDDDLHLQSAGRLSSPDIREGSPSLPTFVSPSKTLTSGKSSRKWAISLPTVDRERRSTIEMRPTSRHISNSLANTITPSETVSQRNSRNLSSIVVSSASEESEPKSDTTAEKVLFQQIPSIIEPSLVGQHPSTFLSTTMEDVTEAGGPFFSLFYSSYPMKSLCGVQVTARRRTQYETGPDRSWRREEYIKMTIGGVLLIDEKLYGLTAAHGFLKDYLPPQGNSHLARSVEYDGDSGVGFEESDDSEVETPIRKSAIGSSSLSGTRQGTEDVLSSQNENQKGKGIATGEEPTLSMKDAKPFPAVATTSIRNGSLGLDWALVELNCTYKPSQVNEYLHDNKVSSIHGIARTLPSRSPVLAILARGSTSGMILGTSVSMRLPGSRKMCEVWTVNLSESIEEGDSGALVINPSNGNVYGHIVAGNIGTGFAYIIPFYQTQLEICRHLGRKSKPTFATAEEYTRWKSLQEEEMLGIRVSSTFDEGPKATPERVLNPTELQRQDTSQRSSGVGLVNEPTKNNPLEAMDYRLALGPNKGRDQIAYEHIPEKNRTSDEAIHPNAPVPPDFDNQDERVRVAALRQGTSWDQFREEVYSKRKRRARNAIMQARRFDFEARYNGSTEIPNLQLTTIHPNAPVPQDFDNPDDRFRVAILRQGAGWDQLREEAYWMEKRRTREAVLPKAEQNPRAVEEEALRPTFRTVFEKAVAPRASRRAPGSLGTGSAGHMNQPASTSSAEGNERTSTEVEWMPNLDSKAAESAPTSSPYTVSGVSKSETGFNMPTVLKLGPSSRVSGFVKKVLHPKQKEELPHVQISTGEYVGMRGLPDGSSIWTAVGPARDLWNQLGPRIIDLLEVRQAVGSHLLTMDLFMVGQAHEAKTPTIFVMCEDKTISKKVVKLVEQSSILDQFPGVKVSSTRISWSWSSHK